MNRKYLKLVTLSIAIVFTFPVIVNLSTEAIHTISSNHFPPFMKPTSDTTFLTTVFPLLSLHYNDPLALLVVGLYAKSTYIASAAWGLFLLSLFYKGKTKSIWHKNGYDYDLFKMLVKMRGGPIRIKILQSLILPKNKLQVANEIGFDWRSADSHIETLLKHGLIKEMVSVGTSKYFIITEKGKDVLTLMNNKN